ncbi:hypothetical protein JOD45_003268 [Scopulibacillus daqui]|uniref:Helix-turn-helix protein n=1 Tax=Scopulibacillus daqui TaxID=1469162 RepID=A0ABS2Q473_9BACL|nr:hypothetical protein [Scopulibacillus daqui]
MHDCSRLPAEFYVDDILKQMEPKIRKTLYSIPKSYREDVEQDLKLKIIQTIDNVKYEETPGFFEFKQKVQGW